ncbi:hypothetical protein H4R18_001571 [Coemansia javaensis]|uniref:EF-hand domain-containing protein n=1 Tax=Coemansia javaensis TaxID=2761396 RepID=A0A9W8HES2_9FUNG|nr:hypothetical protein H4R18_001571 [Coemansia javaensis]
MPSLETLPQALFSRIARGLGVADLAALALTSPALHRLARCDRLWVERIASDFGDRGLVLDLLAEAGVDIGERAEASGELVPWQLGEQAAGGCGMQWYRDRFRRVHPASDADHAAHASRAEAALEGAKQLLRDGGGGGEAPGSDEAHDEAALRLLVVQEYFPASAECYYLWGLLCFMRSALRPALALLTISRDVDAAFAPAAELLRAVQATVDAARGAAGDAPLLDAACAGPSAELAAALRAVFRRLDRDGDGLLAASELAAMVRATNGHAPPPAAVAQMIRAFGGPAPGWDLAALTRFFVVQTIQDPAETRADLARLGIDPHTLRER